MGYTDVQIAQIVIELRRAGEGYIPPLVPCRQAARALAELLKERDANRKLTPEQEKAVDEAAAQVIALRNLRRDMEDTGMVTL